MVKFYFLEMNFLNFVVIKLVGIILVTSVTSNDNCDCSPKPTQLREKPPAFKYSTIEEFPGVVSIELGSKQYFGYNHTCGGSILSSNYVITSASCVDSSPDSYFVRAGSTYQEKKGTIHRVRKIIQHPKFKKNSLGHDIALLKLWDPIEIDSKTKQEFIMLEANKGFDNQSRLVTAGWADIRVVGRSFIRSNRSEGLYSIEMNFIDREDCEKIYKEPLCSSPHVHRERNCTRFDLQEGETCAGVPGTEASISSHGDRGGPFFVDGKLAGVISRWGRGYDYDVVTNDYKRWPSIITLVSHYSEWIGDVLDCDGACD